MSTRQINTTIAVWMDCLDVEPSGSAELDVMATVDISS